jgi:hypothetical protein
LTDVIPGVEALGPTLVASPTLVARVHEEVQAFAAFTPDNDPHGEHDFGSLRLEGRIVFLKVDYHDRRGRCHSPDPADPEQTLRVLTVMLAEEY